MRLLLAPWLLAGAVGGCARLRVPPASVAHEMVHLSDFEQLFQQAKRLTAAWGLPEYKTQDTLRQLTEALQAMARQDASEGLANFTLDYRLQYEVEIAAETRERIVVTPEQPLDTTVSRFCERFKVHRCDHLYSSLHALVVRDWGCLDDLEVEASVVVDNAEPSESPPLPPPSAPPVLAVSIDGKLQRVSLRTDQDLELQIALLCRQWDTPFNDCAALMAYARNVTKGDPAFAEATWTLSPVSSSGHVLHITDPSPMRLNPISERIYFEGEWLNGSSKSEGERRPVCLYYNYQPKPLICGLFPPPDMWYLEPYVLPEGYHLVLLAEPPAEGTADPLFLAARHFWTVTPTVRLLDVSLQRQESGAHIVLTVETESFDLADSEFRLCSLLDDRLDCFLPAKLDVLEESGDDARRRLLLRAHMMDVDGGAHRMRMLLLNSYNKCVATSSSLEFTMTLAENVKPTPHDHTLLFEPPGAGHVQRPHLCPHTILSSELAWICRLWRHEWGRFSQNGEDGVLQSIFHNIGATSKFYVEFGTEDAWQCNSRFLREDQGWSGLLMDGRFANATINLQREWISPENINTLLAKYDVPSEFDLLSVDVDFNDYWILDAIDLAIFSPRVVVIEVNSHLPADEARVIKYGGPATKWDGRTAYFGVSVAAMHHWGRENGYALVYCESHGVNCFLVRDDVLAKFSRSGRLTVGDVLAPSDLHARANFFGRGIQYPWPTAESGIREEWVWLDQ